jgi:outer membrane protein TolC
VQEGAELPLELKRVQLNLAVSREQLDAANLDLDYYEMMLAVVLGYPANDRVKPVDSDLSTIAAPANAQDAADQALTNSGELKQIQSTLLAKELDVRAFKAERLPQIDLVAQYALFAKYNYEQYFQKFQRNNFQLGASVRIPILIGSASSGLGQQAFTDMQKLRIQMDQTRNRIISDTRRDYEQMEKAQKIRDLERLRLDFAREQVSVLLAQNSEGRTPLREVEQARIEESNRWIAWYDAEAQVARAKFAILRQTGHLLAEMRADSGKAASTPE